jgi:transcriptional regulator CtsR
MQRTITDLIQFVNNLIKRIDMKITYDDTRDIAIRCIDKLIELKLLPEDEHNFEVQDLIQDEINNVLGLDIDDNFEINIKKEKI